MENNKERLGTAPLGKLMLELAVPTVFAQLVNMLYNMVDRIYVGRIPEIGSMALAGLGVCFPIIALVSAFSALVGMGGAPQAAIAMGKKDYEGAERILGNCVVFLVVLAAVLSAFFMVFKEPILLMFGASEATLPYGNQYLSIYLLGTISVQISLGLNLFITNQGYAKTSMLTVLIGAVLNIVLDPILIFGMNMGVSGAALATIISQTVSAIWVLCFLAGKKGNIRIRRKHLRLNGAVLKPVILLGMAPFIMQSTECLVQLTFNTGMQIYGNDYYVGAMTIIFSLSQMIFLPLQGIVQGATPIISYSFGAGNIQRVKAAFRMMFCNCMIFTVVAAGAYVIVPRVFVSLFSGDPQIVDIAAYGLRIYSIGFTIFGAQIACQQTFVALGEAKITMFLAMLRKIILLVPLALLLPKLGLGTDGLFIAEPVSDVIAVAVTVFLFKKNINRILSQAGNTEIAM